MKKSLIQIILVNILIINILQFAQAQTYLKVETGLGMPLGSLRQVSGSGWGLGISTQHYFGEKFSLGLAVGYTQLGEQNSIVYTVLPLQAVFRYDLSDKKLKPYLGLGAGLYTLIRQEKFSNAKLTTDQASFGFSPLAGLKYALSEHWNLDFSVAYQQGLGQNNQLQVIHTWLGLAYRF
jgi:opacity protein-like surface antigen